MTNTYVFGPAEDPLVFEPVENEPDLIRVTASDDQKLADFISTVELSGPEFGDNPPTILPEDDEDPDTRHYIYVSRGTLYIYLEFETRYYMFVNPEGA